MEMMWNEKEKLEEFWVINSQGINMVDGASSTINSLYEIVSPTVGLFMPLLQNCWKLKPKILEFWVISLDLRNLCVMGL